MRSHLLVVVALGLFACSDDGPAPVPYVPPDPPVDVADVITKLTALPGVTATEQPTTTEGYHYVVVHFTQPVDHKDPASATFQQEVSLLFHDGSAPMIVQTSGYWDYYLDNTVELTRLLSANQISIEHRFFAESRPTPTDWTKLTIEQMADDEHAIITAIRSIFPGKVITTGGSKGGMTAIYHRRFYPDDVDGSVPYVAPLSFAAPDPRYPPFLDTLGPAACRQALRDVAIEMLSHRRAAMLAFAESEATSGNHQYTRIKIGPAVEGAIVGIEWAFWQYVGVQSCSSVPLVTATDDEMWGFLQNVAPVSDSDDRSVAQFDAYYYQAYAQLGYPDAGAAYLDSYLMYSDADYLDSLPTAEPAYDGGEAMHDVDDFVQNEGDRLLFVYGQWDPWTGGQFDLGAATDSLKLVQAEGSHGSRLTRLAPADRDAAFAKLTAWTGVTPVIPAALQVRREGLREPHVSGAVLRGLRSRR